MVWRRRSAFLAHAPLALLVPTLAAVSSDAAEIRVGPGESIQAAIDGAEDGDCIVVEPGTYVENLNFLGKAITLESEQGPDVTILDGNDYGPVVLFESDEGRDSVLRGFTVRNGFEFADTGSGGGIAAFFASPSILDNVITENWATRQGGGISLRFSTALVQGNTITGNLVTRPNGMGGGVFIGGDGAVELLDNRITKNTSDWGGGVGMNAAGEPLIRNNWIAQNVSTIISGSAGGGGISMINRSDAKIVQNVIVQNVAHRGGGLYWLVPRSGVGPLLVANTIADNDSQNGSAITATGFDEEALLVNNILASRFSQTTILCDDDRDPPPVLRHNDVYATNGIEYAGSCPDATGTNGNLSQPPRFVNARMDDYRLTRLSRILDSGDDGAPLLPDLDFDGGDRVLDGNRDLLPVVDIGAYEFLDPVPVALIDIKPGSDTNPVHLKARVVPVAILGREDFDVLEVDVQTLAFGRGGAAPIHPSGGNLGDVNGDGLTDLTSHYLVSEAAFFPGDTQACLVGALLDGTYFDGCDEVLVLSACGLGYELALLLPPLAWLRRRASRTRSADR